MTDLNCCDICGGKAILMWHMHIDIYSVFCAAATYHDGRSVMADTLEEAADKWNKLVEHKPEEGR